MEGKDDNVVYIRCIYSYSMRKWYRDTIDLEVYYFGHYLCPHGFYSDIKTLPSHYKIILI